MAKNLVIVESPAKAKTINKYLGRNYVVRASMGHVRDLPKSTMGVQINGDVEVKYLVPKDKKDLVKELQAELKKAEVLWLATDLDREGEAIAWHLAEALKAKPEQIRRVTFSEITKDAITESFAHPRDLEMPLIDAQQARRVIDRFVGYRLSPVLWDSVEGGRSLSAGHVQSVATRLVVDREREIDAFEAEEFFSIWARLEKDAQAFDARLMKVDDQDLTFTSRPHVVLTPDGDGATKGDKTTTYNGALTDSALADRYLADLEGASYRVASVKRSEKTRKPKAPFTTSTLQQESSGRLGFGARRTMGLAQRLYEGIEIAGEGQVGLITYMRTDSVNLSEQAIDEIAGLIRSDYGDSYHTGPRTYKTKAKGAQEAHEAIRPTSALRRPELVEAALADQREGRDLARLYRLIWQRAVASQMADARLQQVSADIHATPKATPAGDGSTYELRATGQTVLFDGWLKVYDDAEEKSEQERQEGGDDAEAGTADKRLPELVERDEVGKRSVQKRAHTTKPPARYTEASLVKKLEELGIGRPSTYAPTLSTIADREYVTVDARKFTPTELGIKVNDFLVENFPEYVDYTFTARMEGELDEIADGQEEWKPAVRHFHDELERRIEKVMGGCPQCGSALEFRTGYRGRRYIGCTNAPECEFQRPLGAKDGGWEPVPLDEECPTCGRVLVKKRSRWGWFVSCSGFPECNYSRPLDEDGNEPEPTGETCEKCGKPMVRKRGRYGAFLGCSGYPDCKNIKRIEEGSGVKCPTCGEGELMLRKTKRGKTFYGCSRYPECDGVAWEKPFPVPCPDCGGLLTGAGATLTCQACKHKFPTEQFPTDPEPAGAGAST